MITHDLSEYVDGKGRPRGRCGAIVDPDDTNRLDRIVDCMTCLVYEAHRYTGTGVVGRVVSVNPGDKTVDCMTCLTILARSP